MTSPAAALILLATPPAPGGSSPVPDTPPTTPPTVIVATPKTLADHLSNWQVYRAAQASLSAFGIADPDVLAPFDERARASLQAGAADLIADAKARGLALPQPTTFGGSTWEVDSAAIPPILEVVQVVDPATVAAVATGPGAGPVVVPTTT